MEMLTPKQILSNEGTADRKNWWFWCIIVPILLYFSQILFLLFPSDNIFIQIAMLGYLAIIFIEVLIIIVISVKRLHDTNKSGLLLILLIVPLLSWLIIYYLGFQEGTLGNSSPETKSSVIVKHKKNKACPFCAEEIKYEAIVCRYCGRDLPISKDEDITQNAITPLPNKQENLPKIIVGSLSADQDYISEKEQKPNRGYSNTISKIVSIISIAIILVVGIILILELIPKYSVDRCIIADTTYVYSGPSITFQDVAYITKGNCIKFDARSHNNLWIRITKYSQYGGNWVRVRDVNIDTDTLLTLPQVNE